MPQHARVLIIGGGIVGCSTAYHLSKMGWKDIVLLEKGELTSGSTWHAAGLVGQLRSSRSITRMLKYSVELYDRLEAETGYATGWKRVGGLRVASSKDRMFELRKAATTAKSFGLEMQMLSPKEAVDIFPLMTIEGIVGAAFLPTDGSAEPAGVAMALATGARNQGVKIIRNIRVTGVTVKDGRATSVQTDQGDWEADYVVNCAGLWAREIGKMAGVNVPLVAMQHQYIVSEKIPGTPPNLPTMRDPDNLVYYKEETGGLVMGGYEPNPIPWNVGGIPKEWGQELIAPNFEHFEPISQLALKRTPILGTVGVKKLINGPEAFTPDGTFIMGQSPEVENFYVAAGFNAHGIAAGGGAGKMMAEWIVHGEPSLDLWAVDIRRFGPHHRSLKYVVERTSELYGKHYTMVWPHEEDHVARGIRKSPLYEKLKAQGAVFGAKFGWERANWFAPKGVEPVDTLTFGRANWFEHVGQEHKAIREKVAIIDQTSFNKFEVRGPGALKFLNWLAAANVNKPVGALTYTQLCNERGGIECDLTIVRTGEEQFYIVTGTAFGPHDLNWIQRHLPKDGSVTVADVTSSRSVLNLVGPRSRDVLQAVVEEDISNEAFKFATSRMLNLGFAQVLASRVTYVGELGWELHVPMEYTAHVYDALWEAGQKHGIINAGYRAIESCRLEKGYRYWSTDLTPDHTPFEAGLGFAVSMKKGDFLGRAALEKAKAAGPAKVLASFVLAEPVPLTGGETICRDGKVISVLTSGGYGYTVGKALAMGYLPPSEMEHTDFEITVLGEAVKAKRYDGAIYDPDRKQILA